jgi:hypothetical protein
MARALVLRGSGGSESESDESDSKKLDPGDVSHVRFSLQRG